MRVRINRGIILVIPTFKTEKVKIEAFGILAYS
ncbi:unnamed protein product [Spirodela intermedia]|uniref:Uncharacterized protein n=1 Tax=Spirodela intermedia TaxID=51605 RepID=A0A7I8J286_SPIIN|nr:unnamed protein product [Spirodela intermedia]CAA6664326.1 unnamed protein product [Spirodela intermedia]